ncbi:unnamed protein product [Rhizophagus irregularis]|nr:unnamed protein product [Rhizophagus irregularis]
MKRIRKILSKQNVWITEDDIIKVINMGFIEHILKTEFWKKYQKIKENANEYVKEKLNGILVEKQDYRINQLVENFAELKLDEIIKG